MTTAASSAVGWAMVRCAIVLFRYTPCFYVAAIAALCLSPGPVASWRLAATWLLSALLAAEALFYVTLWRPHRARVSLPAEYPDKTLPSTPEQRRALFDECLAHVSDPAEYLSWWFLGADMADIRRENVREFILWAFFDRESLAPDDDPGISREVEEYMSAFEKLLGTRIPDGTGPARSLRLNFDKVDTAYRGLAWYAVVFLVDILTHVVLWSNGFRYYASPGSLAEPVFPPRPQLLFPNENQSPSANLSYWFKPHGAGEGSLPVVFFHGIGIGLWTYLRLLIGVSGGRDAGQAGTGTGTGILAVEMLHVSFRLTSPPISPSEFVRQVTKILDHHGWDRFAVVSHSYGSVTTTHVLRSPELRHRIPSVVLMDPVTIMLHLPCVAYNFTRRVPSAANEWMLWYFASTDPGVAHSLGRHFFWRRNIIWKRELVDLDPADGTSRGRRVAVCLSGQDIIVDAAAVAKYLEDGGGGGARPGSAGSVEVLLFSHLDHAQVFTTKDEFQKAVSLVRSYCVA